MFLSIFFIFIIHKKNKIKTSEYIVLCNKHTYIK